ncbi:MAG TPA: DUF2255 family protein [Candidatus Limnocylindria bacterium]|nr:DUF2255 family protein [Candidatus Limnocylindria bacterium]
MGFAPDLLDRLRTTREVRIETRRAPEAPAHRTIIWIVVDDRDRVLVRSVRGERGRWYREALAHPACTVWIGSEAVDVRAEPAADPDRVAATSGALSEKYAKSSSLPFMVQADVLETTLELLPR